MRREPDVEVEVIDGKHAELTVLVDGHVVAEKNGAVPDTQEVVAAVRNAKTEMAGVGV